MTTEWFKRHPGLLLPAIAALVYFLQNTSGIKWGDGLEFTAVSAHLGVAHPPGYPLFTLLGWLFLQIPAVEPYQAMLLLCKFAAAGALFGLYAMLWTLSRSHEPRDSWIAGAFAAGAGFSLQLWQSTHVVEVYGLSTALVLAAFALLFSRDAAPWKFLAGCTLAGLAVANHLTSLAIAPALLLAAAPCYREGKFACLTGGLLIAMAIPMVLYLSLMARVPASDGYGIFWGSTSAFPALLDHLRGGEYRQFQFLMAAPGMPFTFETWVPFAIGRALSFAEAVGAIYLGAGIPSIAGGILLIGCGKYAVLQALQERRDRRFFAGLSAFVILQTLFLFVYNIPDYHDYLLPISLGFLPMVFAGLQQLLLLAFQRSEEKCSQVMLLLGAALAALSLLTSLPVVRPAETELSPAWRERLLEALPENAGVITSRDADIYTLWYVQFAERQRLDLAVYGANFNRFPWFRQTMPPDDPRRQAVQFSPGPPPRSLQEFASNLSQDAIDPMLQRSPLFLLPATPQEAQALSQRYQVLPAARLLTDRDLRAIVELGIVNFPPEMLYEIRPLEGPAP